MKKIPVVFPVDRDSGLALNAVRPETAWVLAGEGVATLKVDGTAALFRDGRLWKRYDRKLNRDAQRRHNRGEDLGPVCEALFKTPPDGFEPCEPTPDPVTFHWPGWVPVSATDPADRAFREAMGHAGSLIDGQTYELVGPSLALNVYGLARHELWPHGQRVDDLNDRSFEGLAAYLREHDAEGLVFHHPDGRMAKIRRKDFGLFWVQEDQRAPRRRPRP